MDFSQQPAPSRHAAGFAIVVALHLVVVYALVSGLAKKVVDVVRAPIETKVIEEVKAPPPPQEVVAPPPRLDVPPPPFVPPPEVQIATPPPVQPTIVAQATTPPPAFERPVPPPAPAPPPAAPAVVSIGVACPTQVAPVMPARAEQDGIAGSVRARITVRGSRVTHVEIVSAKPRGVFDNAVRSAIQQYRCDSQGDQEVVAEQVFNFRLPD